MPTPISAEMLLRDASIQDIQLELIRRAQNDSLDGEKVAQSLLENRNCWRGVLLSRMFLWERSAPDLPMMSLIPLRDLHHNFWNADTLFVLCENRPSAERIVQLARDEWVGEPRIHDDPSELRAALGTSREGLIVVTVWWD